MWKQLNYNSKKVKLNFNRFTVIITNYEIVIILPYSGLILALFYLPPLVYSYVCTIVCFRHHRAE